METTEFLLLVDEREKTDDWSELLIRTYYDIGGSSDKKIDKACWDYFNNNLATNRFDYFLKIGNFDLPAHPRHVPLQKPIIDSLVSQQSKRPFVFSVSTIDRRSLEEKNFNMLKAYMNDMETVIKRNLFGNQAKLQQLEQKLQQIGEFMQTEPQDEEMAQQQMEMKQQLPIITSEIELIKSTIQESNVISEEQYKKFDRFYRYDYKDIKEDIAMKVMKNLLKTHKVKMKSRMNFLNKCVTGKEFYYVDMLAGHKEPVYEVMDSLKLTFPAIDGIEWVQDGPWVRISELKSFQSLVVEYGEVIESKYSKEKLKALGQKSFYASGNNATFVSTPGYGAMLYESPYSGTNELSQGISVDKIFVKVPRKIQVKYVPNPHREESYFRHFTSNGKKLISLADFKYDGKTKRYLSKTNGSLSYAVSEVDKYDPAKGEYFINYYTQDVYQGVIIDNDIIVKTGVKPFTLRHPDKHSDVKLPVFGKSFGTISNQPYSVIWSTKDLQDLYDIVHTQRELMLALSGTKTVFYDKGQRPGDLSDDEFQYQKKIGTAWVETITPEGLPKRTSFNQWTMVDLSVSPAIKYLDNMLMQLEETMGNIAGVPRQRRGQVVDTDQVGTYKESIRRAMLITEVMYSEHDEVEAEALKQLLNLKLSFGLEQGDILEVTDIDFGREIVNVLPGMFSKTYIDVLVGDHTENQAKMEEMKQIASLGYSKGELSFENVVQIVNSETVVELARKVEYFTKEAAKFRQEAAQAEHQNKIQEEQAKIKFAQEFEAIWKQQEAKINQMKLELEKQMGIVDAELKKRELDLQEREMQINAKLKTAELMNEQRSEDNVIVENARQHSVDTGLKTLEMQINAILQAASLQQQEGSESNRHIETLKKLKIEDKKAGKQMVKEHASDK